MHKGKGLVMEVLSVTGLTKYWGADLLFKDVTFRVNAGEKVTLVGSNGTGKTTLLKILMGRMEYDEGTINLRPGARVGYLRQDHEFAPGVTLLDEAESVFAHVRDWERHLRSLEAQMAQASGSALEAIMEKYARATAKYEAMDGYSINAQVKRVLFGLGFSENDLPIPAESLSGGQKVRLGLAKLLLEAPELMLLDEPTNHLDLSAVEWLEAYLAGMDSAAIIVSHDRFFLDRIGKRTLELEHNRAEIYSGNYTFAMAEKEQRQTGALDAYKRQQQEIKKLRDFYEKWRSTPRRKAQAMSRKKKLDKMELLDRPITKHRTLKINFKMQETSWTEVLTTENLGFSYGDKVVFADANLKVEKGERVALLGPNGAGKTTFLKTIKGLLEPTNGIYHWGNRVKIGYFSQELEGLDESRTCLEEILELPGFTRSAAYTLLGQFLFSGEDAHKEIRHCSGGERNRLILAKLMVAGANVLLLDEPTNHLDLESKTALEKALEAYQGTVIFVSHDRYFVDQIATKVWEFRSGRVTEYAGNYSAYRAEKEKLAELAQAQAEMQQSNRKSRQTTGSKANEAQKQAEKELRRVEEEIERLEEEKSSLELSLSDPRIYKTPEGGQMAAEYNALLDNLAKLYAQWEEISE